ncbi:MAG TPA: nucleotidyltransferase domain-containing protein, partial [Thermomicrobiales bacterium]|nr:nucleotidyltransferase domain-containing protein [Thermomicrobiales bacterium]
MTEAGRDDGPAFLVELARQRDDLLVRVEDALRSDERVVAAWLAGSFGRGTEDAWSDLDLHVVVRDDALAGWLGARERWCG